MLINKCIDLLNEHFSTKLLKFDNDFDIGTNEFIAYYDVGVENHPRIIKRANLGQDNLVERSKDSNYNVRIFQVVGNIIQEVSLSIKIDVIGDVHEVQPEVDKFIDLAKNISPNWKGFLFDEEVDIIINFNSFYVRNDGSDLYILLSNQEILISDLSNLYEYSKGSGFKKVKLSMVPVENS